MTICSRGIQDLKPNLETATYLQSVKQTNGTYKLIPYRIDGQCVNY